MTGHDRHQLLNYCEQLVEECLEPADARRLEELILVDAEARSLYLDYVTLHGMLAWDAGGMGQATVHANSVGESLNGTGSTRSVDLPRSASFVTERSSLTPGPSRRASWAVVATLAVVGLITLFLSQRGPLLPDQPPDDRLVEVNPRGDESPTLPPAGEHISPLVLDRNHHERTEPQGVAVHGVPVEDPVRVDRFADERPHLKTVVDMIDRHLSVIWTDYEVQSSPEADDAEWLRRSYLDLAGHIPPADVVRDFLQDRSPDKRQRLIARLLESPEHTRHFATVWTNLLVGRHPRPQADREALAKFLRDQFHSNRPWSETVAALMTAEGTRDENYASNFLLAHLNNEAVPATAVACRLFLGQQVLCAQCHKHPVHGWDQERFWQLNACFQQTEIVPHQAYDPRTGTMTTVTWELRDEPVTGATYYEDLRGVMHAAYPGYEGARIDDDESINRREELVRLLLSDDRQQMAAAFVNRTWAHFFGYGLVNPVDDLGPHTASIHWDLLRDLASAFVASDYDVRELCRWICLCRAYQLSSRYSESNRIDAPDAGEMPLFSRMYLKPFSPEQLFDSVLVATSADQAGLADWSEVDARRKGWSQAFYQPAETDDNAELSTFEGSYSQVMVLMNGDLVRAAVDAVPGNLLHDVLTMETSEVARLERLWLATLSRPPTPNELSSSRRLLRQAIQQQMEHSVPQPLAQANAMGDVLWALLNSSEFSVNH